MERFTVLDSITSCHLAQGGGVGGRLVAYFFAFTSSAKL